jgi:hypothetical protein
VPLDRAIIDAARQLTDISEIRELLASAVQRGKILVGHIARKSNTQDRHPALPGSGPL